MKLSKPNHQAHDPGLRARLRRATKPGLLLLAAAASVTVGACFDGIQADGLPCQSDAQCGPGTTCIDGYCDGVFFCDDLAQLDAAAACDGIIDCPDAEDERLELCFPNEDPAATFPCDNGVELPQSLLCDGEAQCEAGDDEGGFCGGVGVNQCVPGEANGDLEHVVANSGPGAPNPLDIEVAQIMGSPLSDVLIASRDGDDVKVVFDIETGASKEFFYFANTNTDIGGAKVVDFEMGSINGDSQLDVVIATTDSPGLYAFASSGNSDPSAFGSPIVLPDLPALANADIVGLELGRLDNDSSTDAVVIVDTASQKGLLLTGNGDSGAPPDGSYFSLALLMPEALGYDEFFDSAMADLDGNTFDDLIVSGTTGMGMGTLWLAMSDGAGGWDVNSVPLPSPGPKIALGKFDGAMTPGSMMLPPRPDIAFLDPAHGVLVTVPNVDGAPGLPNELPMLEGSGFGGLLLADINCDERDDFLLTVAGSSEIRVLFGDGEGGVVGSALSYTVDGMPRGGLRAARFDDDTVPVIFFAVETSGMAEVQILQSDAD